MDDTFVEQVAMARNGIERGNEGINYLASSS